MALYAFLVWPGGGVEQDQERWRRVGVLAQERTFMDLYLFPGSRATLAQGGDPYTANPGDPWRRLYNYPRIWLGFMRFPADAAVIGGIGLGLAALAAGTWAWYLGRLTAGQGLLAGLLFCSPAVMLGVERGNTDLIIFALLAAGAILGPASSGARTWLARGLWFAAALLKLYPVLAWAAWCRRPWDRALRLLVPAGLAFAAYLLVQAHEIRTGLSNTAAGWVLSYGVRVPAKAMTQFWTYYRLGQLDEAALGRVFTLAAVLLVLLGGLVGRRWRLAVRPGAGHTLGFVAGASIYVGTFLAGNSFNYRLIFLLLTLPWLWRAAMAPGAAGRTAVLLLVLLPCSLGFGYQVAGWGGFFVKELADWGLAGGLTLLLAAELSGPAPEPATPSRA